MIVAWCLIYLIGLVISLFISPIICSVNPHTGKPISALVHMIVAICWPVLMMYLLARVMFGSDDDDNEMGS